jgi:Flp pilus assembly protein TadG
MSAEFTIRRARRGTATVEFALLVPVFLFLVLGIVESGLVMTHYLAIQQAAHEGARSAAIGEVTSTAIQRALNSAPGIGLVSSNVTLEKSTTGSGAWSALADSAGQNNAVTGNYVRVTVLLQHQWITSLFSTTPTTLHAVVVARRE